MNKLLMVLFLSVNTCKCDFSEKLSFVKWEKSKKIFVNTNIAIGTLDYSLNIESCEKKKNNLKVVTTVFSQNQNEGKFYIIGNNARTNELDTLSIFTKFENEFLLDLKKYNYFIFKEENNEIGTKYLIQ